jgi:hypothetical protein
MCDYVINCLTRRVTLLHVATCAVSDVSDTCLPAHPFAAQPLLARARTSACTVRSKTAVPRSTRCGRRIDLRIWYSGRVELPGRHVCKLCVGFSLHPQVFVTVHPPLLNAHTCTLAMHSCVTMYGRCRCAPRSTPAVASRLSPSLMQTFLHMCVTMLIQHAHLLPALANTFSMSVMSTLTLTASV